MVARVCHRVCKYVTMVLMSTGYGTFKEDKLRCLCGLVCVSDDIQSLLYATQI